MTMLRSHKFGSKRGRRGKGQRGSVIVLVVAVLGLLAVIGTVYIVSSRSERGSASASNVAVNLDKAQQAVNEMVASTIGSANLDGNGTVGGYNYAGPFGLYSARRWDIPELDSANMGTSFYNANYRDQTWLSANLYAPAAASTAIENDFSLLTNAGFNPASGSYDSTFRYYADITTPGFKVVSPAIANNDAFVQLLPFSEASGMRYRVGIRIIDTSRMANLSVGSASTAAFGSDELFGTYHTSYRLAVPDIFDTVDTPLDVAADLDTAAGGRLLGAAPSNYGWEQVAFRLERSDLISAVIAPSTITPFDVTDELALRVYGNVGTSFVPRPVGLWPKTLGANTVGNFRRSFYTAYSYSRDLRPFNLSFAPFTLTTPSAPFLPPALVKSNVWPANPARVSANVDLSPARIANAQAADFIVIAATNIASAMERIAPLAADNYTHQEACSFAANYLTYRWNSWAKLSSQSTTKFANFDVYNLTNGPSFIDQQGIGLRTDIGSVNYGSAVTTTDLQAEPNKVYLGYAAQPFINEIAETQDVDISGTNPHLSPTSDCAIELYNPYNVGLSLDDYEIYVDGPNANTYTIPAGHYVPPRGYFVLVKTAAMGAKVSTANSDSVTDGTLNLDGATHVYLMRKYLSRTGAAFAAVDQYTISALSVNDLGTTAAPPADYYLRRSNSDDTTIVAGVLTDDLNRWIATVYTPTDAELVHVDGVGVEKMTLGDVNPPPAAAPTRIVPLHDHILDQGSIQNPTIGQVSAAALSTQRAPFANVNEFNQIVRLTNEVDANPASTPPGLPMVANPASDNGTLSTQLDARINFAIAPAILTNCQSTWDANVHFDFRSPPWIYNVSGVPADTMPIPPGTEKSGDYRAMRLLECITFVDRVSDYTVDVGDSEQIHLGVSKIRIPGQINVNTASAEVLSTIPILAANPKYIGAILAYRWRTSTASATDPRMVSLAGKFKTQTYDFSNTTNYPGYGIRSLGELNVALTTDFAGSSTIAGRDFIWADVYNYLTVRSDTFAVYAYLEAVKQNPRYAGTFNNGSDWYVSGGAAPNYATDDPTDANAKLLRVARRRWVSIVDRSLSNYPVGNLFVQPRIVAQKDLPQ